LRHDATATHDRVVLVSVLDRIQQVSKFRAASAAEISGARSDHQIL
jgi:hypothetical protein